MPLALRPAIPLARDALLVGDPGRALMLAQELLDQPKMSNHARGLWGYTGSTPAGSALTVQATGMGGPSAAVVLNDLFELGVRRVIRVGTGAALRPGLALGDLLVVTEAHGEGAPPALPGAEAARPDPGLLGGLEGAGRTATARSGDLPSALLRRLGAAPSPGGDVHDLQTAVLLAAAHALGIAAAALLIVAEDASGARIADEPLTEAAKTAGRTAADALSKAEVES
ncbi:MAG TPA: hypothetical protein VKA89_07925 [Solirubrobacterales bacterium]|nr:hypothetical protein [Solirubrobacterales bacterium]